MTENNDLINYYYRLLEDKYQFQQDSNRNHRICDDYDATSSSSFLFSNQLSLLQEIRDKLSKAIHHGESSAMVMIGNQYEAKKLILSSLQQIVDQVKEKKKLKLPDIRQNLIFVDGQTVSSDYEAFQVLSSQCLRFQQSSVIGGGVEKNLSALLEDLEAYFHHCRQNKFPAIIIVDSFHSFTKYKRQMFIYTLLDYIHKSELLFLVIGLTEQADIYMKLEKRVLSRLNSQYCYMKRYNVQQLSQYMLSRLLLPKPKRRSDISQNEFEEQSKYSEQFNLELSNTFGVFLFDPSKLSSTSSDIPDTPFLHTINVYDLATIQTSSIQYSKAGTAFSYLQMLLDWGKTMEYFDGIIYRLSISIDEDNPFITVSLLQNVVEAQERLSLPELLSPLSTYERMIYAVIGRIQCQQVGNHHNLPIVVSTSTNATNDTFQGSNALQYIRSHHNNSLPMDGKKEITIQQVLTDFDKLSGILSSKTLSVQQVLSMIAQLAKYELIQIWNSAGPRNQPLKPSGKVGDDLTFLMDHCTVITTNHTQYEITSAFKVTTETDPIYSWKNSAIPTVVIPERYRRAVLEPMNPILMDRIYES